ncbi:MAG: hypothetical protein AAFR87_30655 [Bacteroidota bacterium]
MMEYRLPIENEEQLAKTLKGVKGSAIMTDLRRFPLLDDDEKYAELIERKIHFATLRLIPDKRLDLRLKLEELVESSKSSWIEEIKQAQIDYLRSKGNLSDFKDIDGRSPGR